MRRHAFFSLVATIGLLMALNTQAEERDFQTARYFWGLQVDELEYRYSDDDAELGTWDANAYVGSDELKFRWRTKGETDLQTGAQDTLENHFLVETPISDYFNANAGVRIDTPDGVDRTYGVIGVSGLAPYWFEVGADLYVSQEGDASTRLDAEYEALITERLILRFNLDTTIAFSEDREIGVGKGLNSTEFGARLSYDVMDRLFSPYVGVVNERLYGKTRELAEDGSANTWFAVLGARLVF